MALIVFGLFQCPQNLKTSLLLVPRKVQVPVFEKLHGLIETPGVGPECKKTMEWMIKNTFPIPQLEIIQQDYVHTFLIEEHRRTKVVVTKEEANFTPFVQ